MPFVWYHKLTLFSHASLQVLIAFTSQSWKERSPVSCHRAKIWLEEVPGLSIDFLGMTGDLVTCMAGMNCGTPSDYGWKSLKDNATAFLSCKDELAFEGMKLLDKPMGKHFLLSFAWFLCEGQESSIISKIIWPKLKIIKFERISSFAQVPMCG